MLDYQQDTIQIDTLSIVPNSLEIKAWQKNVIFLLPDSSFQIQYPAAQLILSASAPIDSIQISYRVFPFLLNQSRQHKDATLIQPFDFEKYRAYEYQVKKKNTTTDLFNTNGLDYNGSFGRGISFGNNQDVVVNSNFDLRMTGKLPGDIEVLAAITDNNIPFQAEGNTQQLQEFDRIFIQLKKDRTTLLAGDYDLKRPDSYFLNFNRSLQGLNFATGLKLGQGEISTAVSGAISKGNYNRLIFNGEEGNQGPYKLAGANGELFIIVLSGSERIYIDGNLLTRGASNDYVIDYNTAELTFTDKQLINKDKRIVIEFEYADRNYLRSLFYANAQYKTEKFRFYTHLFSEQDAKNQPLVEGEISDAARSVFESVGDNIEQAVVTNFAPIEFDPDRIMYKRVDTMVNNVVYDIFVFSTHPDSANYVPAFRFVGENQGNYILSTRQINGRIYEWRPPDSLGNLQGNYALGGLLITPKTRQMATIGASYQLAKNNTLSTEIAFSKNDANTFSDLDDEDDAGMAVTLAYYGNVLLNKKKKWQLQTKLKYEGVQQQFRALEAYRPIEFTRDWNLDNNQRDKHEHIGSAQIQLQKGSVFKLSYQLSSLIREGNVYRGFRHVAKTHYQEKGWSIQLISNYLSSTDTLNSTQFFRPNFSFAKTFKKLKNWSIGIKGMREQNRIFSSTTDSLSSRSFFFDELESYVKSGADAPNQFQLSYIRRWDYVPKSNDFSLQTLGNTFAFSGKLAKNPRNQLSWNLKYRNLKILLPNTTELTDANTFLGDVNYLFLVKKGFIRSNIQYQIGSGQRQRTEYLYYQVPYTEADYVWLDRNEDGEQDLDEFELITDNTRNTPNAVFRREIVPTNEFEKTNTIAYTQNFSLNPRVLWAGAEKGIKKWLTRFSLQSNINIKREMLADSTQVAHYLPFGLSEQKDSVVVAANNSLRNTLYFNRNNAKFESHIFRFSSNNKNLLTNGTDERSRSENGWYAKFGINRKFTSELKASFGQQISQSVAFVNRNYRINFANAEPSLSYQPNTTFRITAAYKYKNSKNILNLELLPTDSLARAIQHRLTAEAQYGSPLKTSLNLKFSFVHLDYQAADLDVNSALAFALLEGLQPNSNFLWSANVGFRLSANVYLNLNYDGRKSGDNAANHVGRASLRANF